MLLVLVLAEDFSGIYGHCKDEERKKKGYRPNNQPKADGRFPYFHPGLILFFIRQVYYKTTTFGIQEKKEEEGKFAEEARKFVWKFL